MKLFLTKLLDITLIVILLLFTITVVNSIIINYSNLFVLDKKVNILVLGDSHTKYAINDNLLDNVSNYSEDADSYFYSYLKLKILKKKNNQIDTLVLSFSEHNISKSIEDRWLLDSKHLKSRLMYYYPLFNKDEISLLLREKPKDLLLNLFSQILSPVYYLQKGDKVYGGYEDLNIDNLEMEIMKQRNNEINKEKIIFSVSDIEKKYLSKIKQYCAMNDITLVLLNSPVHKMKKNNLENLYEYYRENFSGVVLLDYSNLNLPDAFFADLVHLNPQGSTYFTMLLKTNGFSKSAFNVDMR